MIKGVSWSLEFLGLCIHVWSLLQFSSRCVHVITILLSMVTVGRVLNVRFFDCELQVLNNSQSKQSQVITGKRIPNEWYYVTMPFPDLSCMLVISSSLFAISSLLLHKGGRRDREDPWQSSTPQRSFVEHPSRGASPDDSNVHMLVRWVALTLVSQ